MADQVALRRDIRGKLRTDEQIARIAERQHGVVARRQLLAIGLSADAIDRRLALGRLHAVHRGVFAVGHTVLSREGRWLAAVLAAGDGAVLSHQSAAALWGMRPTTRPRIDVTTPRRRRSNARVQAHHAALEAEEVALRDGIPVTSPTRTLADLAAVLPEHRLERAVNEAERLRLDVDLGRYPRLGGLVGRPPAWTRSELEARFLSLLDDHGLARPEVNVPLDVGGRLLEVDCVWRGPRLIVELDGYESHGTRAAFERDRARDRRLVADGWRVARITWRQIEAGDVAAELRGLGI